MKEDTDLKSMYEQIIPPADRYCRCGLNQVKFISNNQTLSLVLGSCISTVFIGKDRNNNFHLAANHIVLAKPHEGSIVATKSAKQQIEEILDIFSDAYTIVRKTDLFCLHLIGAGNRIPNAVLPVHLHNIRDTKEILKQKGFIVLFSDIESFFVGIFSIKNNFLSIFVENKINNTNIAYTLDLLSLFRKDPLSRLDLPASALKPNNEGFEHLVKDEIIITITGPKDRAAIA